MICYGRNVVKEALSSNFKVSQLYIQENIHKDDKIQSILNLAKQLNTPIKQTAISQLKNLTHSNEHQGVACDINFQYKKLSEIEIGLNDSYIYISDVTYEHNLGAIIRTAECAGMKGVIIPNSTSLSATAIKTSTGAAFHIDIIKESIFNTIKFFKKNAIKTISIERGGSNYSEIDMTGNTLFIIGGEDKSVSQSIIERSDFIATIPQHGKVNSLNMSVAAAIIMYERVRQVSVNP